MDVPDIRRLFPSATQRVFLDAAAISIASTPAADAVRRLLGMARCSDVKIRPARGRGR